MFQTKLNRLCVRFKSSLFNSDEIVYFDFHRIVIVSRNLFAFRLYIITISILYGELNYYRIK